ncbi:hypothetical protein GN956_G21890 [Arapaima gigas]
MAADKGKSHVECRSPSERHRKQRWSEFHEFAGWVMFLVGERKPAAICRRHGTHSPARLERTNKIRPNAGRPNVSLGSIFGSSTVTQKAVISLSCSGSLADSPRSALYTWHFCRKSMLAADAASRDIYPCDTLSLPSLHCSPSPSLSCLSFWQLSQE